MTTASMTLMAPPAAAAAGRELDEDAELVRRFLDGRDPLVFAQLVRKYERPVFRMAASVLGPSFRYEAEDLTQEIFVHVYHKLGSFRFASKFSTWLYRVSYRKAIDLKRRARYQRVHLGDDVLAELPRSDSDPLDESIDGQAARALRRAVDALPEPQRTTVLLFYWMESSIAEIATVLDAKPVTVRSHLFRARAKLARVLEAEA